MKDWETEARVCFAYVPWEELWCENRGHPTTSHVVRRKPRVHARFLHVDAYCGGLGSFGHVYIWALFPLYFTSFRMLFSSFLFSLLTIFVFFYAALPCDSLRPSREGLQTAAFAACVENVPGKPDILPLRGRGERVRWLSNRKVVRRAGARGLRGRQRDESGNSGDTAEAKGRRQERGRGRGRGVRLARRYTGEQNTIVACWPKVEGRSPSTYRPARRYGLLQTRTTLDYYSPPPPFVPASSPSVSPSLP